MSVFEELIDELKEENLLEETVFSVSREKPPTQPLHDEPAQEVKVSLDNSDIGAAAEDDFFEDVGSDAGLTDEPSDERETYRRRATDEVSSLQMVEHVLSGIEREHMKMAPATFDDLSVKKALHQYLQVTGTVNSQTHSEAEYALFQETEKWFSALSKRDANISVANIRRFCENSRPILSSQALMALARFYRNSPVTEAVRGKFDFVMTRLFSRETGDAKRKLLFGRIETLEHIKALYANWASLAVIDPADPSGVSVSETVSGFEDFVRESESAESFDQQVASDFFNRVRLYKEQTHDLFYDPAVTAAAIECNVRLGNRFIDLIQQERDATGEAAIEDKYGYSHDTIISHAASKTLLLLELLRESRPAADQTEEIVADARPEPQNAKTLEFERAPVQGEGQRRGILAVNRWLLVATLVAFLITGGLYFWSENAASVQSGIEVAPGVALTDDLKTHLREASVSSETLYGMTQPTWDALPDREKKEFVSKAFEFAKSKGMKRVNFLNSRGRTVAFASDTRIEVLGPQ